MQISGRIDELLERIIHYTLATDKSMEEEVLPGKGMADGVVVKEELYAEDGTVLHEGRGSIGGEDNKNPGEQVKKRRLLSTNIDYDMLLQNDV